MRTIPYGYEIVDGNITVNEEKAQIIRDICANYLSGASLQKCCEDAGFQRKHSFVGKILENKIYVGTDIFPQILSPDVMDLVEAERLRRVQKLGRENRTLLKREKPKREEKYCVGKIPVKYKDPIKQVEYAYGLIKEVSEK